MTMKHTSWLVTRSSLHYRGASLVSLQSIHSRTSCPTSEGSLGVKVTSLLSVSGANPACSNAISGSARMGTLNLLCDNLLVSLASEPATQSGFGIAANRRSTEQYRLVLLANNRNQLFGKAAPASNHAEGELGVYRKLYAQKGS